MQHSKQQSESTGTLPLASASLVHLPPGSEAPLCENILEGLAMSGLGTARGSENPLH